VQKKTAEMKSEREEIERSRRQAHPQHLGQMSIALTDAGLFAAHLVVLGWGVPAVLEGGDETIGLLMIIVAGGLFVWKMHVLFNQRERK
jgi:hypothetical protein